jgi:hypothetical protein
MVRLINMKIRYKSTVLDATDEAGMVFKPDNKELFCPCHYINTQKNTNVLFLDGPVVNQIMFVVFAN